MTRKPVRYVGRTHKMMQDAYTKGREDAIDECIKILTDDCKCEYEKLTCFECMTKRMEQLKEQSNE